jgi:hypothetical protein
MKDVFPKEGSENKNNASLVWSWVKGVYGRCVLFAGWF